MPRAILDLIASEYDLEEAIARVERDRGLARDPRILPVEDRSDRYRMGSEDLPVFRVVFFYDEASESVQLRKDGLSVIDVSKIEGA